MPLRLGLFQIETADFTVFHSNYVISNAGPVEHRGLDRSKRVHSDYGCSHSRGQLKAHVQSSLPLLQTLR